MQSIRQWLAGLGLEQYAMAFESSDVDMAVLPALCEADLERLGVSLGHRKRILLALEGAVAGAPQRPPSGARSVRTVESLTVEGERRQVTVLFCDLVGSTSLSSRLDPEEYRRVLARYHETCIASVQRFEGFVAQIQGDGVLAYFGYPLAHEGEAERAIRAALATLQALAALDVGLEQPLSARIGIASGMVVVSHMFAPEKSAVGETPNLAQRLQTLAQPGEVMVSERTRTLAAGTFDYAACGLHVLKGLAEPTRVWCVLGPSSATSRFEAATRDGVTPMVGREQEIALLLERWELARSGEGQVVLLEGEPGIGKSRMLRAFREWLGERVEIALQYQCSPYHANSAFYPIAEHLARVLRFERDDGPEEKLVKIERYLLQPPRNEGSPRSTRPTRSRNDCSLLGRMLSISCDQRYGPLEMSPQRQKDDTIGLLVDLVAEIAIRQPTVVLFEDVHWADPTTLEVLGALVDRTGTLPLLVLITYRPEFTAPWSSCPHLTPLVLARLSRTQGASIVLRVADKPLPSELVSQIVDKTDGVPLFLEELTKAVLESSLLADLGDRYDYSGKVEKLAIPDNLRDSLMARLDRLIPVKEIAQIGACLGRTFSYELVRAVSPMDEAELSEALGRLTASELVFQRGATLDAVYTFKHALVQDAAYDSLLKSKRQTLHAQIAHAIRERFPAKAEVEPELLAHHYTEAGLTELAIPYWQKAGELAQNRVALREAILYYERGLSLLPRLPASTVRDTYELRLRALLGITWVTLHGYTHPQIPANLEPALALDRSLADGDYTLRILWGLWVYTLCAGRIKESLLWAEKLIAIGEQSNNDRMRLAGHWAACDSHYFLGSFTRTIQHAEAILALYDAERDRSMADLIIHDPKTIALAYRATAEWKLGYPDRAAASAQAAISHSRQRKHVFDLCWVHTFLAHTLFSDCANEDAIASGLDEAEQIGTDQKIPFFTEVYCPMSRAFWLLRCGRPREAAAKFEDVTPRWRAAELKIYLPTIQTLHAESLLRCGRIEAAMRLLDEALESIARPGWEERGGLSEVLRVKAWALVEAGDARQAETTLEEALLVAQAQHAKAWELRAATGYGRLLRGQGRIEEALAAVRPVYEWFSEGHHTPDLLAAATLLAELDADCRERSRKGAIAHARTRATASASAPHHRLGSGR